MTLRSVDDYREWKFCVAYSYPLVESMKLVDNADLTSFDVGCKNGHQFTLVKDNRRGEVRLSSWVRKPINRSDTGLDAWGMCAICGRLPNEHGRCPTHG